MKIKFEFPEINKISFETENIAVDENIGDNGNENFGSESTGEI